MQRALDGRIYLLACLGLVSMACGGGHKNGGVHGELVNQGVTVGYETHHAGPSFIERLKGSPGISSRITLGGATVASVSGGGYPHAWDDGRGDLAQASPIDWQALSAQLKAVAFSPQQTRDKQQLLVLLQALAESPAVPAAPQPNEHRLSVDELARIHTELAALEHHWDAPLGEEPAFALHRVGWFEEQRHDLEVAKQMIQACMHRQLNTGYRNPTFVPGWEFKQVVELYKMPVFRHGWEHSGTLTRTYKRRSESDSPWVQTEVNIACNHGPCPRDDTRMAHYETCRPGVISDWYVVDGACKGSWFQNYVYNNDTVLQIVHARGIWTADMCPDVRAITAPDCGDPWAVKASL